MSSITYNQIVNSFQDLFKNDPLYRDLNCGYMSWYDVCRKYDPTYDVRPAYTESEVESEPKSESLANGNCALASSEMSESDSDDDIEFTAFVHITPTKPKKPIVEEAPWAPIKPKFNSQRRYNNSEVEKQEVEDNGIRTIVTRNLPRDITKDELRKTFETYGPVRDVHIPINADRSSPYYGTIRGFAMIEFLSSEDSATAYNSEYGKLNIRGKYISIDFAKGDRKRPEEMMNQSSQSQQQQQQTGWTKVGY